LFSSIIEGFLRQRELCVAVVDKNAEENILFSFDLSLVLFGLYLRSDD
jgi:hypothetical protein